MRWFIAVFRWFLINFNLWRWSCACVGIDNWVIKKQFGNVWSGIMWPGQGLETNKSWSYPLYGQEILSFLNCSRTALEPDHPVIQRASEAISPGIMRPEREADHSLLVPRLQMREVTRPLPNTPSWRVEIYRLAITIIPSWRWHACQCCQRMASLGKSERATWALTLLQRKTLNSIGRHTNHIQQSHSG